MPAALARHAWRHCLRGALHCRAAAVAIGCTACATTVSLRIASAPEMLHRSGILTPCRSAIYRQIKKRGGEFQTITDSGAGLHMVP